MVDLKDRSALCQIRLKYVFFKKNLAYIADWIVMIISLNLLDKPFVFVQFKHIAEHIALIAKSVMVFISFEVCILSGQREFYHSIFYSKRSLFKSWTKERLANFTELCWVEKNSFTSYCFNIHCYQVYLLFTSFELTQKKKIPLPIYLVNSISNSALGTYIKDVM